MEIPPWLWFSTHESMEVRYPDSWVGYLWVARTPSVFRGLDQWLRRRSRCYQWK